MLNIFSRFFRAPEPPYRGLRTKAFICGCGHSGTTLLATILSAHPDTFVPLYETNIFLKPDYEDAYRKLRREARQQGKIALIEKTPRHVQKLELIRNTVPRAKFIIPVRDGRDVAASVRTRIGTAEAGVTRWIENNRYVLPERGKPDVLIYRHEDLVADPERLLRRICRFLRLNYDPRMLDYHKQQRLWFKQTEIRHASGFDKEHVVLRNWQVNQPIFDNSGRWKKELSEADIAPLMRGEGRRLMRAFGYLRNERGQPQNGSPAPTPLPPL